jgi:hypothetical protein
VGEGLAGWCRRWLGAEPAAVLFRAGYLSEVTGLRLAALRLPPPVVGHADWESQNIRWRGGRPLAVHDWDSAVAQPEAVVAGLAAAVWPAAGAPGEAATVEQTERFLAAYERARGRAWTPAERQAGWAAGLWVRAFNAKKQRLAGGGPHLDRLAPEIPERAARAGLGVAAGA